MTLVRPQDSDDNVIQLLGVIISAVSTTKYIAPNILLTWRAVCLERSQIFSFLHRCQCVGVILGNPHKGILKSVQSVVKNKSDFLGIVKKCKTIKNVLKEQLRILAKTICKDLWEM